MNLYPEMLLPPLEKLSHLAPRILLCIRRRPRRCAPHQEHDSSLVLLEVLRKFRMLQVAKIHEGCKMNSSSTFVFYFREVPRRQVHELVTCPVHRCFGIWNFHRFSDSDGFVAKAVVEFTHISFFPLCGPYVYWCGFFHHEVACV